MQTNGELLAATSGAGALLNGTDVQNDLAILLPPQQEAAAAPLQPGKPKPPSNKFPSFLCCRRQECRRHCCEVLSSALSADVMTENACDQFRGSHCDQQYRDQSHPRATNRARFSSAELRFRGLLAGHCSKEVTRLL